MNSELMQKFDCNQGAIRAVRYNVDGSYCLSCGADRKVKLFNPKNGQLFKFYAGHGDEVMDAMGSCDNSYILSGSADKSIIYWDVISGLPIRRIKNHVGTVTRVKFNDDSKVAISGSRDNSIQYYDIRSSCLQPIQTLKDAKDCITDIIVTENKIISSSLDGFIRHYDIRAGELTHDKIGIPITAMAITDYNQCILISCQDEGIRLVDIQSGDILAVYKGHGGSKDYRIECEVFKDDKYVITGSNEGEVIIYDMLETNEVKRLKLSRDNIISTLCKHPTQDKILFGIGQDIQELSFSITHD